MNDDTETRAEKPFVGPNDGRTERLGRNIDRAKAVLGLLAVTAVAVGVPVAGRWMGARQGEQRATNAAREAAHATPLETTTTAPVTLAPGEAPWDVAEEIGPTLGLDPGERLVWSHQIKEANQVNGVVPADKPLVLPTPTTTPQQK